MGYEEDERQGTTPSTLGTSSRLETTSLFSLEQHEQGSGKVCACLHGPVGGGGGGASKVEAFGACVGGVLRSGMSGPAAALGGRGCLAQRRSAPDGHHYATLPPHSQVRKTYTITKQRERWSEDEHAKFLDALRLYGRQWRKIEGSFF